MESVSIVRPPPVRPCVTSEKRVFQKPFSGSMPNLSEKELSTISACFSVFETFRLFFFWGGVVFIIFVNFTCPKWESKFPNVPRKS